jgi:hypothetical protein
MAVRTFANITDSLVKLFYDDLTNNINRQVVLAQLLDVRNGTGQNVQWIAKFGTATPASRGVIADGADVTVFNRDTKIPAVLQYGTYHDAFDITGKSAAAAAAAGNPDQLADLFEDDMMDSAERLARGIAEHCYSGDGSTDNIHGLTATAGPLALTGTYAGIDKGVQTQWASNQVDALSAGLSFGLMRRMRRNIWTASGQKPNLIICDAEQHENYGNLFGNERRYVDYVRIGGKKITLDGGYQVLEFDGIPVVEDEQCPANTMLFLNTRFLYLSQLPDPLTMYNQSMGHSDLMGTDEEQFGEGTTGLTARIIPLAKTGDSYKFELICYPQLVSRRQNVHGRIVNLA